MTTIVGADPVVNGTKKCTKCGHWKLRTTSATTGTLPMVSNIGANRACTIIRKSIQRAPTAKALASMSVDEQWDRCKNAFRRR